jgi:hypothetical protein
MRHRRTKKDDLAGQKRIFCTECGANLENFCFSSKSDDLEAIRKTLAQCKKKGRIMGDFCAKLFVVDPNSLTWFPEDTDLAEDEEGK